MLVASLHALADFGDVGKDGLLVAFTQTLWWGDLVRLGAAGQHVGMLRLDEGEEAREEQRVRDGLASGVGPDASALLWVAGFSGGGVLGGGALSALSAFLAHASLGQLGVEVTGVLVLLRAALLLLFLQCGRVEFAVGGWGGLIAFLLGLLGLLLLGETLEHVGHLVDVFVSDFRSCGRDWHVS